MKLVCPNKDCKKDVDIKSSSRFRVFECEACGFMFRGIHARVNRFDFFFRPKLWLFVPKWWIPDVSYDHPITATPCPHCWSKLTVLPADTDPPDSYCPDNCWSCHHPLPTSRVDLFSEDFVTEKICEFIVKNPDLFPTEETPPDPPTPPAPKTPPADLTKGAACAKIKDKDFGFNRENQEVNGAGVTLLQSNFLFLRNKLASKDDRFNQIYERFESRLSSKVTMREAFDMVRLLSSYQHLLQNRFDKILELLVKDFQKC
jgi:hypothetical protein